MQIGRIGAHADTTWESSPVFRLSGLHVDHAAGRWGHATEYVIKNAFRKISFNGHIWLNSLCFSMITDAMV